MRPIKMGIIVLACASLIGCLTPKPKLTARYRSYDLAQSAANNEARLSVFVLNPAGSNAKSNILGLSERGQAALITSLNDKSNTAGDLLHNLASPIAKRGEIAPVVDHTIFKRRVVFSIENGKSEPADRLAIATVTINGFTENASFLSWDRFASKYETVDLGRLVFQQNNEINLGVTAVPPVPGITGAEAAGKATRNLEEELLLKQRFVEFTGALTEDEARITQQGVLGRDLTGNQTVDVEIKVKPHPQNIFVMSFPNLWDGNHRTDPAKMKMLKQRVIVPENVERDLKANAALDYILRRVIRGKGDRTILEGDDDVTFIKGRVSLREPFILIPIEEFEFLTWWLVDQAGQQKLHVTKRPGDCSADNIEPIRFTTYSSASSFLNWLTKDHTRIGELRLCFGETPLAQEHIGRLQVNIVTEGPGVRRRTQ